MVAYNATKAGAKWKSAAENPGPAGSRKNGKVKGPSPNKKLKTVIYSMIAEATNKKEQLSTQDEIAQFLLAMVASIVGATEKKKADIGSVTASS